MTSAATRMGSASIATALPVLDMALLDRDEGSAARFRDDLGVATHDVGFFYLVGSASPPT